MTVVINGTTGITDVNGTAAAPAITGTDTDTGVFFGTNTVSLSTNGTERLQVDASGNAGLGVTPSAWGSDWKAVQVGARSFYGQNGGTSTRMGYNWYQNSGGTNTYIGSDYAFGYLMDSAHKWLIAGSGSAGGTVSFTQAMTLDASGRLGLGTSSPSVLFHAVGSSSATQIRAGTSTVFTDWGTDLTGTYFENTGTSTATRAIRFQAQNGSNSYTSLKVDGGDGSIQLGTANTERARIDSSGNLMIGMTSTSYSSSSGFLYQTNGSDPYLIVSNNASGGGANNYHLYSRAAGLFRFYVGLDGVIHATSTSISAISDVSVKENIRDLETGLSEVMALQPRRFDWKNGDGTNVAGFIAQEVEQVLPELVTESLYTMDADGNEVHKKNLKMGDILPTLVKAIQEQQAIIQQLQADVQALKGNA